MFSRKKFRYVYEDDEDDISSSSSGKTSVFNYKDYEGVRNQIVSEKEQLWSQFRCLWNNATDVEQIEATTSKMEKVVAKYKQFGITRQSYITSKLFPEAEAEQIKSLLYPITLANYGVWRVSFALRDGEDRLNPEDWLDFDTPEIREGEEARVKSCKAFRRLTEVTGRKSLLNLEPYWIACIEMVTRQVIRSIFDARLKRVKHIDKNPLSLEYCQKVWRVLEYWGKSLHKIEGVTLGISQIYKHLIDLFTDDIYNIVIADYPNRTLTLQVLIHSLKASNDYGREWLTEFLVTEINKKLLLAAIDTKVILHAYSSCVEALQDFDQHCATMHRVCAVIKEYLKKRTDTIQQIIAYITTEKKDAIGKNMATTAQSTMIDDDELYKVNDEFLPEHRDMNGYMQWLPDPIEFLESGTVGMAGRGVDVFNMLVSVYGSKDLFVKEYRSLLAERLCNSECKDVHFEKNYLNLLKLRFQDSELQNCDVMLEDLEQSRKMDLAVSMKAKVPISGCIVSSHYWPKIDVDKGDPAFPPVLQEAIDTYHETYKKVRDNRKLKWLSSVGCVDLRLELDGVVIEKIVPNVYANLLYLFLEKESWRSEEVAERFGISKTLAHRRLEWWAKQGLVVWQIGTDTTPEEFVLTKNPTSLTSLNSKSPEPVDEEEQEVEEANDIIDSLEQFWKYTLNYIKNNAPNGEVKADRMHRLYKMFGSPSSAGPTIDHVNAFLQRKVKLGLLVYANGTYRIHPTVDQD